LRGSLPYYSVVKKGAGRPGKGVEKKASSEKAAAFGSYVPALKQKSGRIFLYLQYFRAAVVVWMNATLKTGC